MSPLQAQACEITLWLEDAAGNGWGDASLWMQIHNSDGDIDTLTYTMTGGFVQEFSLQVGDSTVIIGTYMAGSAGDAQHGARLRKDGVTFSYLSLGAQTGDILGGVIEANCAVGYLSHLRDCERSFLFPSGGTYQEPPWSSVINGDIVDLEGVVADCLGEEVNGLWYRIRPSSAVSTFEMTLSAPEGMEPQNYDFSVWGPYYDETSLSCSSLGEPIRCSRASTNLPTGLDDDASDQREDELEDGWVSSVAYGPGSEFLVFIQLDDPEWAMFNVEFNGGMPVPTRIEAVAYGGQWEFNYRTHDHTLSVMASNEGLASIEIWTIMGQVVPAMTISTGTGDEKLLDLSSLLDGSYIIRAVSADGDIGSGRFVKY